MIQVMHVCQGYCRCDTVFFSLELIRWCTILIFLPDEGGAFQACPLQNCSLPLCNEGLFWGELLWNYTNVSFIIRHSIYSFMGLWFPILFNGLYSITIIIYFETQNFWFGSRSCFKLWHMSLSFFEYFLVLFLKDVLGSSCTYSFQSWIQIAIEALLVPLIGE